MFVLECMMKEVNKCTPEADGFLNSKHEIKLFSLKIN